MAQLPRSLAEQVGSARVGGGGNYIQHGKYVLVIDDWRYQKIQDECIIIKTVVAEAHKVVVFEGDKKVEDEPNPVGSEASSVANFDGEAKLSAPANARAPILGLFGFKENGIDNATVTATLEQVTSDAQPACGMVVGLSTFPKEKRNKRGEYIVGLNWEFIAKPGQGINEKSLVEARKAARAQGTEALVKLTQEHLAMMREGKIPSSTAPAGVTSQAAPPAAAGVPPSLPGGAPSLPPSLPAITVDTLKAAGWQPHPQDAEYMWRGTELKKVADLLAGK